jgi:hypothetical protein
MADNEQVYYEIEFINWIGENRYYKVDDVWTNEDLNAFLTIYQLYNLYIFQISDK